MEPRGEHGVSFRREDALHGPGARVASSHLQHIIGLHVREMLNKDNRMDGTARSQSKELR